MKHEKALSDLQRFGEMFSGLVNLATDMRDIGSVEQAAEEAQVRATAAAIKEEQALEALEAIKRDIDTYKAEHVNRVEAAEGELHEVREQAAQTREDMRHLVKQTQDEAARIAEETIADARKRATDMLAAAEAEAVAKARNADAALIEIAKQEKAAQARLDAANGDVAAAHKRLDEINAEIERVKARFA